MDGSKTAKSGQKKTKPTPEESSGDDGALQIDESAGKTIGKKQTNGGKPKKKTTNVAVPEWSVGDLVWAKVSGFVHWPAKVSHSLVLLYNIHHFSSSLPPSLSVSLPGDDVGV